MPSSRGPTKEAVSVIIMKALVLLASLALLGRTKSFAVRGTKAPAAPPPIPGSILHFVSTPSCSQTSQGLLGTRPISVLVNSDSGGNKDLSEALIIIQAKRYYGTYMSLLETNPLTTKSVSAALVSGIGNIFSQWFQAILLRRPFHISYTQMFAFGLTGLVYVGPWFHVWYEQLGRVGRTMESRFGSSQKKQTLAQILIDQTLGVAIFFPTYFYVYEILESFVAGRFPLLGVAHGLLREQIGTVVKANYCLWPFFQYINFTFVPSSLRVLATNLMSVLWNCYFCSCIA